ncbi:MAG: hypothetical protein C0524_08605 [Rhodobacter sp.]|nr:hypothetical protein [Rhodobacter sp.]
MDGSSFRIRALILGAYLLAAVLPMLALAEGRQESPPEHEQMIAMAGHVAQMPATENSADTVQLMFCQQHCFSAAAAFPVPSPEAEAIERSVLGDLRGDLLAASLAIPPPGPPPKPGLI